MKSDINDTQEECHRYSNRERLIQTCFIALTILFSIVSILRLGPIGADNSDMSVYLTAGIELWDTGAQNIVYPSVLFQVLSAVISGHAFGLPPQIAYVGFASCILYVFSVVILYRTAAEHTTKELALVFVVILTLYKKLYPQTATRALTDAWLMFCFIASACAMIEQRPKLSGVFAAFGIIFRIQGIHLMPFVPILAPLNKKKILSFVLTTVLAIAAVMITTSLVFTLQASSGFSFYNTFFDATKLLHALPKALEMIIDEYPRDFPSKVFSAFLVLNIAACVFVKKNTIAFRVNIFGVLINLATYLVGCIFMAIVFISSGYEVMPDPRYLAYALPFSLLAVIFFVHQIISRLSQQIKAPGFEKIIYMCIGIAALGYGAYGTFNTVTNYNNNLMGAIIDVDGRELPNLAGERLAIYPVDQWQIPYLYFGARDRALYRSVTGSISEFSSKHFPETTLCITKRWISRDSDPDGWFASEVIKNEWPIKTASGTFVKAYKFESDNLEFLIYRLQENE